MRWHRMTFLLSVLFLGLGVLLAAGAAQDVKQDAKKETETEKEPLGKEPPGKDPTEPGPMFDFLLYKAGELPPVNLKAKILTKNRPPMAIIEVAGKEFIVSKNSTIPGPNYVLEVVDIQPEELKINWTPSKAGTRLLILK
jgi:hypothetical protein